METAQTKRLGISRQLSLESDLQVVLLHKRGMLIKFASSLGRKEVMYSSNPAC